MTTQPITETEKLEKLWNKDYIRVMLSNFLLFFAFYLLTPLLPLYLVEAFGADKHMIGIVLSGYVVATLLIRPFSGFIVDSFDRKRVLTISFFIFFICFAGYLGAATMLMFAIVRTIHGLPFGAATVSNSTVAIDVLPSSRRNEGLGFYGLSNNLAMALAPSVGIWIYNYSGRFELLFWLSLLISFIAYLSTTAVNLPKKREAVKGKPKLSLDHFFLTRGWLMAVNMLLFATCWGVMSNYVALFSEQHLGITDGTGLFFMLLSLALFAARLFGNRNLRRGRLTFNCTVGVTLSTFGYLIFALAEGEITFYLAALLIGLGNGQMFPAMLNMFVAVARHDQRGTANSSLLISWDLGMGLGILLGGFVAEFVGFIAAFWIVAALHVAGTLLFIVATRHFFMQRRLDQSA